MIFRVTITNNAGDVVKKQLKLVVDKLVKRLAVTTPGKASGKWSSTINKESATVSNPAWFLRYLEEGTGIYGPAGSFIVPKNAKVLHWTENGHDIFVKRVKGIKPRHFISAAVKEV
jgi:hypothetical protein